MGRWADYSFTREDVDRAARAMKARRDALWLLESDGLRESAIAPPAYQIMPRGAFDRIAKVTGARVERFADFGTAKLRLAYCGVEFWAFDDKEVA